MSRTPLLPFLLAIPLFGCSHISLHSGDSAQSKPIAVELRRQPTPLPEVNEQDWTMFRDDVERSGFAEGTTVGNKVEALWHIPSFNTTEYGAVKGSPSVVGDMLYCGTDTGRFVAVRISDGAVIWQVQISHTSHGIHGSPAIVGNLVYIGAYDGNVYAFERMTGLLLWRHKLGFQVGSSPAVVPRWGMLFSSQERSEMGGGYVVALDANTGEELWQHATEAHPHSSVAVDVERGRVFVGDNQGIIYALEARSGAELWRRELDHAQGGKSDIKTTPTVIPEKGLVVFGAWSGKVYALDELTGKTVWEHPTGGHVMGSTAYLSALHTIYIGNPGGFLRAIDADTGLDRWSFRAGGHIYSSPAVSGDGRAVVFGASDGNVYAIRADDGQLLWEFPVGGQVSGSPTLAKNRIYVTGFKGELWALATHD